MNASESFQLEVLHDGKSVRNLSTVVSHPDPGGNVGEPFYGFIFDIGDFLGNLFS